MTALILLILSFFLTALWPTVVVIAIGAGAFFTWKGWKGSGTTKSPTERWIEVPPASATKEMSPGAITPTDLQSKALRNMAKPMWRTKQRVAEQQIKDSIWSIVWLGLSGSGLGFAVMIGLLIVTLIARIVLQFSYGTWTMIVWAIYLVIVSQVAYAAWLIWKEAGTIKPDTWKWALRIMLLPVVCGVVYALFWVLLFFLVITHPDVR